jgi:tetrahydromethanopterin S-methyltransferase subunit G
MDIEDKLASAGLTLEQVVNYALEKADKQLDKETNPVDYSITPYLKEVGKKIGGDDE